MNVGLMSRRLSPYERALQQQKRRQAEKTLRCPECGKANKPGSSDIDIDDCDDARCPCGHVWQVRVE